MHACNDFVAVIVCVVYVHACNELNFLLDYENYNSGVRSLDTYFHV